jgi:hypothetical protein
MAVSTLSRRFNGVLITVCDLSGDRKPPNLRVCTPVAWVLSPPRNSSGVTLDMAHTRFTNALEQLRSVPESRRDRTAYTTVLGNLGVVEEARGHWAAAENYHREALRLRREVAGARCPAQSSRVGPLSLWSRRPRRRRLLSCRGRVASR